MNNNVTAFPQLKPVRWDELASCIDEAILHSGSRYDRAGVLELIRNGMAQWWAGEKSAIVTQIMEDGKETVLLFWLAGGDLSELRQMEKFVSNAAQQECGCTVSRIMGRRGWIKSLEGYHEICTVAERRLER